MKEMIFEKFMHFTIILLGVFETLVGLAPIPKMIDPVDTRVPHLSQRIGFGHSNLCSQRSRSFKLVNVPPQVLGEDIN